VTFKEFAQEATRLQKMDQKFNFNENYISEACNTYAFIVHCY